MSQLDTNPQASKSYSYVEIHTRATSNFQKNKVQGRCYFRVAISVGYIQNDKSSRNI